MSETARRPVDPAPLERDPAPSSGVRVRCHVCFKPLATCLCDLIEPVANRTHVTILQHPRERFHAIGTARIAALGLERSRLVVPRDCFTRSLEQRFPCPPDAGVLFPSPQARALETLAPDERPSALVVLDGTWSQARHLHRANAWLHDLPHLSLRPLRPTRYRIRKAPRPEYVSTLEAIVRALEVIEPETQGLDRLLDVFDTMIDRQLSHQGRNPRRKRRDRAGAPPRTR